MPSSVSVSDSGAECKDRCPGRLDLVGIREVLEDIGDRRQQHRDRVTTLVGLEHRRTAEADISGEDRLERREVLALGRGTEPVALHATHAIPFSASSALFTFDRPLTLVEHNRSRLRSLG